MSYEQEVMDKYAEALKEIRELKDRLREAEEKMSELVNALAPMRISRTMVLGIEVYSHSGLSSKETEAIYMALSNTTKP